MLIGTERLGSNPEPLLGGLARNGGARLVVFLDHPWAGAVSLRRVLQPCVKSTVHVEPNGASRLDLNETSVFIESPR